MEIGHGRLETHRHRIYSGIPLDTEELHGLSSGDTLGPIDASAFTLPTTTFLTASDASVIQVWNTVAEH
jgi:hypothetical protein